MPSTPMPGQGPARFPRVGFWRVGAAVCLCAPLVGPLLVPLYASGTPRLLGIPFFYWYQLAWVLLTPVFMVAAYLLARRSGGDT